jgi:hypothetical protein
MNSVSFLGGVIHSYFWELIRISFRSRGVIWYGDRRKNINTYNKYNSHFSIPPVFFSNPRINPYKLPSYGMFLSAIACFKKQLVFFSTATFTYSRLLCVSLWQGVSVTYNMYLKKCVGGDCLYIPRLFF